MMFKKRIAFLLIVTIALQIKAYSVPTERLNTYDFKYKRFSIGGSGYLFSKDKKLDIDTYDGCSIFIKIYKNKFFHFLTIIPFKKLENVFAAILYFRSFYLDVIKFLIFYESSLTIYNKGRHRFSRSPYFKIDFGYVLDQKFTTNAYFLFKYGDIKNKEEADINKETICIICHDNLSGTVIGHYDNEKKKYWHFLHERCGQQWLNINNICPTCKKQVAGIDKKSKNPAEYYFLDENFGISIQGAKFTYEYRLSNFKECSFCLKVSFYPLIASIVIPRLFFKRFSPNDIENINGKEDFKFDWHNSIEFPKFLYFSLYSKISAGLIVYTQKKFGILFEMSYIKSIYDKMASSDKQQPNVRINEVINNQQPNVRINEGINNQQPNVRINEEINNQQPEAEDKGYKFDFKLSLLIIYT